LGSIPYIHAVLSTDIVSNILKYFNEKIIIERKLPGAGNMTPDELKSISTISVDAISQLNRPYTWVQSFVTEDKIYCIHIAEKEADIREHAKSGNFPVSAIED